MEGREMNIFKKKKDFNKKKFLVKTIVLTLLTTLILSAFLPHFSACGTNLIGNNVWEDLNGVIIHM